MIYAFHEDILPLLLLQFFLQCLVLTFDGFVGQDIREHWERKLVIANDLYLELSAAMLQLEQREKELLK